MHAPTARRPPPVHAFIDLGTPLGGYQGTLLGIPWGVPSGGPPGGFSWESPGGPWGAGKS